MQRAFKERALGVHLLRTGQQPKVEKKVEKMPALSLLGQCISPSWFLLTFLLEEKLSKNQNNLKICVHLIHTIIRPLVNKSDQSFLRFNCYEKMSKIYQKQHEIYMFFDI